MAITNKLPCRFGHCSKLPLKFSELECSVPLTLIVSRSGAAVTVKVATPAACLVAAQSHRIRGIEGDVAVEVRCRCKRPGAWTGRGNRTGARRGGCQSQAGYGQDRTINVAGVGQKLSRCDGDRRTVSTIEPRLIEPLRTGGSFTALTVAVKLVVTEAPALSVAVSVITDVPEAFGAKLSVKFAAERRSHQATVAAVADGQSCILHVGKDAEETRTRPEHARESSSAFVVFAERTRQLACR